MSVRGRLGLGPSQFRITPAAMFFALGELGLSLVWLLAPEEARTTMVEWVSASPSTVFERGHVWTLATSPFLEPNFLGIILHMVVLWSFVPTLERFWGTTRFVRFVAITSLVGTVVGTLMGHFVTGMDVPITGLNAFIDASLVAFGITYARQPVQFFGVLPLTGRQLMYGFIGFLVLSTVLQQAWETGAASAAAMATAALMTSKWSPMLAWKRRKIAKARAKLSVMQGGVTGPTKPKPKKPDERFLN
ncbi:rhomboid family intramembrane serine protease [Pinirhizobacter sp.]|jgi:membrane associated rhomboid family serine protease|uniref:rhomboid family intramembrane serine protease n=1 Tax=Pinirhizobacter sp. TaxID=2950432 RepID=UPI002F40E639